MSKKKISKKNHQSALNPKFLKINDYFATKQVRLMIEFFSNLGFLKILEKSRDYQAVKNLIWTGTGGNRIIMFCKQVVRSR